MHTRSLQTYVDRIRDAVLQIEQCPPADYGLPFINMKNLLPHDALWPMTNKPGEPTRYEAFNDSMEPMRILRRYCAGVRQQLGDAGHDPDLADIFLGRSKTLPFVVNYAFGVGYVVHGRE